MHKINKDVIEASLAVIDDCERLINQRQGCLLGANTLVKISGMYLKVETDENNVITESRPVLSPAKATHFTPRDGKMVANGVRNGFGDKGETVTWKQACLEALEQAYKNIEFVHSAELGGPEAYS